MGMNEDIQKAIESGNIVIGYRESIKSLKSGEIKSVIISNNIPDNMKKDIEHNAKISGAEIKVFEGSSKDLGTVCGKPFSVTILAIK